MVALGYYEQVKNDVDLSVVCGFLGLGCTAAGAVALADSIAIPDEIPVAAACTGVGAVCGADFIVDTYGDSLCENPSFDVYEKSYFFLPGPKYLIIPQC